MSTTISAHEAETDEQVELSDTVLLYDAMCGMCRTLAYKFRESAKEDVEIVALSSPKAEQILGEFYPNGWEHDYYLVSDGTCRKGIRALPHVGKIAGVRNSGALIKEYASHTLQSSQCDECDQDHDHSEQQSGADNGSIGSAVSRRTFAGMLSAAAVPLSPLSGLASATDDQQYPRPPADLRVRVATVTQDGNDGFETTIQSRPDLIRSQHALKGKSSSSEEDSGSSQASSETTTLSEGSLASGDPVQVQKMESAIQLPDPDPKMRTAMEKAGDRQLVRTTSYHGFVDHERYGLNVHTGRGPAVTEDEGPTVATTMAGIIEHDVAQPIIDYIVVDIDDVQVATHTRAYVEASEALAQFYAGNDNMQMGTLYKEIANGMREVQDEFEGNVTDQQFVPSSSYVAISGLPQFEGFAELPEEGQSDEVTGYACSLSCGCNFKTCCSCGVGCGLCLPSPCKACGCCVAGCACSVSCCV